MTQSAVQTELVFFVLRRELSLGLYPLAEPVVIIDEALDHRYVGVRYLELLDPPAQQTDTGSRVLPVFVIDPREAVIYDGARPAVISQDRRTDQVSWTTGQAG